jgi:phosphatidylinositol-3-phosphatase
LARDAIHPSEGNYVALVGGDAYGITDDNAYTTHEIAKPSIVDQLEGAGLSRKAYLQDLPTPGYTPTCYPLTGPCLYASKHDGFLNFAHVQDSPRR